MQWTRKCLVSAVVAMLTTLLAPSAIAGKTLENIRLRGQVICGVHTGLAGFSAPDADASWKGLDVDVCRAIAAATLGTGDKVKFVPLPAQARFTALQSGEIDVLSRNTTFTLTRDASLGLNQTAVTYYDGQGFIVHAKSRIKSLKQLKGQTICVQSGTTSEKNLADYSKAHDLAVKAIVFEKLEAAEQAYFSGRCLAYSTDTSGLASVRNQSAANPSDHVVLRDIISKEPLGPMVRRGDDEWFAIVKWVIYGLIEAEELGITQANVDAMKSSNNPAVARMLGTTEDSGKLLGLDRDWMARAIKTTGNYGEIFNRNVGPKSALQLPRGLNNLWNQGGLMYGFPVR